MFTKSGPGIHCGLIALSLGKIPEPYIFLILYILSYHLEPPHLIVLATNPLYWRLLEKSGQLNDNNNHSKKDITLINLKAQLTYLMNLFMVSYKNISILDLHEKKVENVYSYKSLQRKFKKCRKKLEENIYVEGKKCHRHCLG